MVLTYFHREILTNRRFVAIFLSYLILCLTVGGFHDSICNVSQCNHVQQLVSDNNDVVQLGILDDVLRHDSETCQICQWLKDSSSLAQFVFRDKHFVFIGKSLKSFSNPVLPFFPIYKFTIRPPPQMS